MPKYESLSQELSEQIERAKATGVFPKVAFDDSNVIRRRNVAKDKATVWRPPFVHDIDKILHCPYYNIIFFQRHIFSIRLPRIALTFPHCHIANHHLLGFLLLKYFIISCTVNSFGLLIFNFGDCRFIRLPIVFLTGFASAKGDNKE